MARARGAVFASVGVQRAGAVAVGRDADAGGEVGLGRVHRRGEEQLKDLAAAQRERVAVGPDRPLELVVGRLDRQARELDVRAGTAA